jgi:NitT/TauT family transport system permease protein
MTVSQTLRKTIFPALTLVGLLILWQAATVVFEMPRWLLPAPTDIGNEIVEQIDVLWEHSLVTLYESLAGFAASVLIGVPLAMAIVWSPYLRNTICPVLLLFQSIPKTALAPLIVIWAGTGIESKVIVAFLVAFFPIVVDTVAGMVAVEPDMLNLTRSLKSTRWQEFRFIRLPNALPYFFSGARVAITLAIIGAVIGEFIGGSQGLGYLILVSTSQLQTSLVFGCLLILSLQGIALFYGLGWLERLVLPWFQTEDENETIGAGYGG